ncbi:hypothetical protein LV161_008844 [Aspergillus fumigatus]|nr:hypothetical protein LV161_008844 [Aspergillus fumigatus]
MFGSWGYPGVSACGKAQRSQSRRRYSSAGFRRFEEPVQYVRPASCKKQDRECSSTAKSRAAASYGIPVGYSLRNWDPAERPIVLAGSVFDSNSLGKWIFDWARRAFGAGSVSVDIAGDLWLLMIRLAGRLSRLERLRDVRTVGRSSIGTGVNGLLHAVFGEGLLLWDELLELVSTCGRSMYSTDEYSCLRRFGQESGIAFVQTLLRMPGALPWTQRFMRKVQAWERRFDEELDGRVLR